MHWTTCNMPRVPRFSKMVSRLQMLSKRFMYKKGCSRVITATFALFLLIPVFAVLRSRSSVSAAQFVADHLQLSSSSSLRDVTNVTNIVTETIPSSPNQLSIAVVVSRFCEFAHVRLTVLSLKAIEPDANICIVHFARSPDPDFAVLTPKYRVIPLRRPYDDPLQIIIPESPPTLLVVAGTILSRQALNWLKEARSFYGSRPDVAAFALDGVFPVRKNESSMLDHEPSVWKPVKPLPPNDAFIFRSCPIATAIMFNSAGTHFQPLSTFYEWLSLRRNDWYRAPKGPGIDDTPLGMSALAERDWTRVPWNVWFSQFLHEYQLGVVYPNLGASLAVNELIKPNGAFPLNSHLYKGSKSWKFDSDIATFLGTGQIRAIPYFSEETIQNIIQYGKDHDDTISFTMVNNHFITMARSWLCNVDGGNFRPKGLLWAVTDNQTHEVLKSVEGTTSMWLNEIKGGKGTGHEFGNPGYWKLMLERTSLITEILNRGIAVFAFETDAIWLEDPMPYINELTSQDADIVGTINSRMEISGNFFYLRPTLATRRLWNEITTEFTKAYDKAQFQKKKADSWTYIQNDQSLLTSLVLRNHTWRRSYPLSFLTLDMGKFVDGRWYNAKEGLYATDQAREPVVINNNFVVGVGPKISRAKIYGHWFWDEEKHICLDDAIKKAVRSNILQSNSSSIVTL